MTKEEKKLIDGLRKLIATNKDAVMDVVLPRPTAKREKAVKVAAKFFKRLAVVIEDAELRATWTQLDFSELDPGVFEEDVARVVVDTFMLPPAA